MLKKINKSSFEKIFLILIIGVASFLRFFRLKDFLGFWYDQGRDALVIWDMVFNGKFTLIGPQMGFTGIFRGGWYYYLIAPFYALDRGNPIPPYVFLIATTIIAIFVLYILGKNMGKPKAGLLAGLVGSVSMYIVGASRWFSDPTPTLLISVLLVLSLYKYTEGKSWWIIITGFLCGMALQFSAATEIFYVPGIMLIVFLLRKKVRLNIKQIFFAILAFVCAFGPQIIFEIRHPGVQTGAFFNFVFHEKTFTYAFWEILKTRLPFDYNMFASKFWIDGGLIFAPFFIIFIGLMAFNWKKLWQLDKFKVLFILAAVPIIGTLFFVSNLGGVYEYYFTGYYLIWILLFSYVYIYFFKSILIKICLSIFIFLLIFLNLKSFSQSYCIDINNSKNIIFANELAAIEWIYKDANGRDFNVDEYVPPVIPYAYEYLFKWLGTTKYRYQPLTKNIDLLYTLYEADDDHPERLGAWMERQKGIGRVVKEAKFGSIVVQERQRLVDI